MTSVARARGASDHRLLRRGLLPLLTASTGLFVASMYIAQPLLHDVGASFHLGSGTTGLIVTASQVGYVLGLCLLVPLGDLVSRRWLLPAMAAALAACLLACSISPSAALLLAASTGVGALSVGAQATVALAATLAPDADRGRVVGTVMSGLLLGILLARSVAGYLATWGTWRTPFQVAAAALLLLAVLLRRLLPGEAPKPPRRYLELITSVGALLRSEPVLRRRALYGAASFGAFSALWTPLAFLLSGPPFGYSTATIGLFGLLGLVGAASASLAGRVADRGRAGRTTVFMSVLLLLAWVPMAAGGTSVAALVGGVVLLDLAAQGLHITNQSTIYALLPEARSRLTAAYMTVYFAGGVIGSALSSAAYARAGWLGACAVGAAISAVAAGLALATGGVEHRAAAGS